MQTKIFANERRHFIPRCTDKSMNLGCSPGPSQERQFLLAAELLELGGEGEGKNALRYSRYLVSISWNDILVSYYCCNKSPHTEHLKTTSFMILQLFLTNPCAEWPDRSLLHASQSYHQGAANGVLSQSSRKNLLPSSARSLAESSPSWWQELGPHSNGGSRRELAGSPQLSGPWMWTGPSQSQQ